MADHFYRLLVCILAASVYFIPALIQRVLEKDADYFGAVKVGFENYTNMLRRLNQITNGGLEIKSLSYPTLEQRIKSIAQKMKI